MEAQELAAELMIPLSMATVMLQRGIDTVEKAEEFFDLSPEKLHDPWLLPDIHPVVDRLEKAIKDQELKCKKVAKDWARDNKKTTKQSSLLSGGNEGTFNGIAIWSPEEYLEKEQEMVNESVEVPEEEETKTDQ